MPKTPKVITKGVSLDPDLVEAALLKAKKQLARTAESPSNRDLFRESVARWLPYVLDRLQEAGVRPVSPGNQRPRSFDQETWEMLAEAEEEIGYPIIGLLRCCLELTREKGL
jgi:hypothetical protein